jgi:hypothetical protein
LLAVVPDCRPSSGAARTARNSCAILHLGQWRCARYGGVCAVGGFLTMHGTACARLGEEHRAGRSARRRTSPASIGAGPGTV